MPHINPNFLARQHHSKSTKSMKSAESFNPTFFNVSISTQLPEEIISRRGIKLFIFSVSSWNADLYSFPVSLFNTVGPNKPKLGISFFILMYSATISFA